jgi:DNA-binding transcriptional MocR family regulator
VNNNLFVPAFANPAGSPIRELFPYLSKPGIISFAGGYPSTSLFDAQGLQACAARVMSQGAGILQYGATEGVPALKEELLKLSSSRGIVAAAEQLLVTTGSQQAFDLLVRIFVQPGDSVLLETPTYPAAIQALRLAGANVLEVPMDAQGLQTQALAALLDSLPKHAMPKLLYTVPTFSNPRGTLLPDARRMELVSLAQRHGFLIVEDDPYGELAFTDESPAPLYVHGARLGGENPVAYLSSLSKTVAPALRVGWMIASPDIVRRGAVAKQTVDLCTSPITQLIAADYLQSGRYPATVRAACAEYRRRADAMAESLNQLLGDALTFQPPAGGMFLWADCATGIDAKALFQAGVDEGVLFVPGAAFHATRHEGDSMRLSFAAPGVEQIREGVARLARAFHKQTVSITE